jgi:pentatricopeptide repeat protein
MALLRKEKNSPLPLCVAGRCKPKPPPPLSMASAAASSSARSLSRVFSSTQVRTQPQTPEPALTPKAPTGRLAKSKPDQQLKSLPSILKQIFLERDPDKLVSKFLASTPNARFRDRHRVYEVAVSRLASFGRHDAVTAIIEGQKPFLDDERDGFAARLVRLYGRASMPSHAAATFRDLPPQHKTVITFNALLAAYLDSRDFGTLSTAFQEIPASCPTVIPNVYTYNILINALCQKLDFSAAFDVITLMEKSDLSPDIISFNTLLNGFYNNGQLDNALKVWEMMKERNVEPDTKSYNAKLRGLVPNGRIEDAAALIDVMEKHGPKPDTVSYNELIRGYCKEGRLDEAKKVYDDLVRHECAPNAGTFGALVPRLVEAGELDRALNCCHEIFSRKCRVDVSLLQGVVIALADVSRMEDAKRIVELGRKNYYPRKCLRMPHSVANDDVEVDSGVEDSILYEDGPEEEEDPGNA